MVDAFARYRINDPLRFYQTLGSIEGANSQLADPAQFGAAPRARRGDLHPRRARPARRPDGAHPRPVDREAAAFGIEVVDVRIRRADLPEQNSQAVYQRMQTERQREAAEFRAQGSQRAQEIRSRADREVTVLVADATSKAEQIRGEGDATAQPDFRRRLQSRPGFLRLLSLDAGLRRTACSHNDTRLLLKPDTNFFRYFNDPIGQARRRRRQAAGGAPRHPRRPLAPDASAACPISWPRSVWCS